MKPRGAWSAVNSSHSCIVGTTVVGAGVSSVGNVLLTDMHYWIWVISSLFGCAIHVTANLWVWKSSSIFLIFFDLFGLLFFVSFFFWGKGDIIFF
mmetsp:Transcript_13351/g.21826  ORF Transcript_13351/g.21826 Transcript_13351/m.21826 type:complete len:95 (-) Transcript_13351:2489-2773(-)